MGFFRRSCWIFRSRPSALSLSDRGDVSAYGAFSGQYIPEIQRDFRGIHVYLFPSDDADRNDGDIDGPAAEGAAGSRKGISDDIYQQRFCGFLAGRFLQFHALYPVMYFPGSGYGDFGDVCPVQEQESGQQVMETLSFRRPFAGYSKYYYPCYNRKKPYAW